MSISWLLVGWLLCGFAAEHIAMVVDGATGVFEDDGLGFVWAFAFLGPIMLLLAVLVAISSASKARRGSTK